MFGSSWCQSHSLFDQEGDVLSLAFIPRSPLQVVLGIESPLEVTVDPGTSGLLLLSQEWKPGGKPHFPDILALSTGRHSCSSVCSRRSSSVPNEERDSLEGVQTRGGVEQGLGGIASGSGRVGGNVENWLLQVSWCGSGQSPPRLCFGTLFPPQDVMVVGEPTLMGGEFGDEDERLITRLENTQFDAANGIDDEDSFNNSPALGANSPWNSKPPSSQESKSENPTSQASQ